MFRAKLPTMPRDKNKLIAKTDTTITHKHPPKRKKKQKRKEVRIIFNSENYLRGRKYSKRNNFIDILFFEYVQMSRAG